MLGNLSVGIACREVGANLQQRFRWKYAGLGDQGGFLGIRLRQHERASGSLIALSTITNGKGHRQSATNISSRRKGWIFIRS